MSESLQGSKKPTDHHTKPLGQQKLQSPQRPRPSGHHSLSLSLSLFLPMLSGCPFRSSKTTDDISKKTGTQKVDFLGTSNFGSDMRLSPRIRWNLIRRKVLKKSTFCGPPILVLTWGCHLESDEISKNEGAQKVGFLGLQNTGPSRRCPRKFKFWEFWLPTKTFHHALDPTKWHL